jgi:hypothetical protein
MDDFGLTQMFLETSLPHFKRVVGKIAVGLCPAAPGVSADYIARVIYHEVASRDENVALDIGGIPVRPAVLRSVSTKSDIIQVAELCIDRFQIAVREQGGHLLVQGDETRAQVLFRVAVEDFAAAHGVDLSREVETGRGPVDFKLSNGAVARLLIEMKRVSSSAFWDGLRNQVPVYLTASSVTVGFFVPIVQDGDSDLDIKKVEDLASELSKLHGFEIRVRTVDARRPLSASKIRGKRSTS